MDKQPGWKPSAFSWAMGRLILQRMADGETMKAITADPRMPAYCTVYRWVKMVPEFGDAYRQVRTRLAQVKLEERDGAQALKPRRKSGRRSTYEVEWGAAVCEEIENGASLSEVVRMRGMPSFKAIYRWLRNEPAFRADFVHACGARAFLLRETIRDVALCATSETTAQDRAEIAELEARIGRLTPRLYREPPR